ncbi:SCO family protein [Urechidicola sp. KH5]
MKNKSYIGIAFIVLIFGIYTVPKVIDRFTTDDLDAVDKSSIKDKGLRKHDIKESKSRKGTPLFAYTQVPPFEFINQHGKTITNESYNGKVYVVEFFFTTCPTICPIMNRKMVKIQNAFEGNDGVGFASISINPKYDTPEVLTEYAEKYGITSPNWHMLTGKTQNTVYTLANDGFKLYAGEAGEEVGGFEHSGLFALIDQNGTIRSRVDENGNPILYYRALDEHNMGDQINELIEDINVLLDE